MANYFSPDGYLSSQLRKAIADALSRTGIDNQARPTVIDIGCGTQPYRMLVESSGASYTPCDIGEGPHVLFAPGGTLPFPESSFDIGLSIQVLEHVWDLDWYLGLFRTQLKTSGHLILSTHGVWPYHPHPEDFRRWTREGLRREIESRGFRIERMVSIMGPLAWTTQVRLTGTAFVLGKGGAIGRLLRYAISPLGNSWMWIQDKLTPESLRADNACVYLVHCRPAPSYRVEPS